MSGSVTFDRTAPRAPRARKSTSQRSIWRNRYLYLLALPGLVFFLIFKYVPMWGVVISFEDFSPFKGVFHSSWVGFAHFHRFFSTSQFWLLFRNTMVINLMNLVFFFPLPVIVALMLNEVRNTAFKRVVQSIIYLPHFLSWVVIVSLTFLTLSVSDGIVNSLLAAMHLQKVQFLTSPRLFWFLVTGQSIWKEMGWGTIIFLAAMAGVDPQLYEAARMDGASRLSQMWHVTLPAIRAVVVVLLILRLGHMMDIGFEQIWLMYNGAVSNVAEVFDTYVYRVGIQQGQFSFSTAVGLFKSVVGLILVLAANWLAKVWGEEGVF